MEELKPPQQPESVDFRKDNEAENPTPNPSAGVFEPLENLKNKQQLNTDNPQSQPEIPSSQVAANTVPISVDIEAASKKTPEEIINVKVGSAGIIDGSEVEKLIGPKGEL